MITREQALNKAKSTADEINRSLDDGEHATPIALLFMPNGDTGIVPMLYDDTPQSKDRAQAFVDGAIEALGACGIIQVSEVWVTRSDPGDGPVRDMLDARSVLQIVVRWAGYPDLFCWAEQKPGQPLGPWEHVNPDDARGLLVPSAPVDGRRVKGGIA